MRQATVNQPLLVVIGRVRQAAVAQGWLLTTGGQPEAPEVPMTFRRGFGSMKPSNGLVVELAAIDASSTQVSVTAWRGSTVVDGFDADRMLQALGVAPA